MMRDGMIWATLKMTLALGAVMTLLVLLVKVFKRWEGGRRVAGPDGGIRVLTSKLIGPQKYVSLVEIGGEVLALGVSAQQITFLTKIENKELVKRSLPNPGLKPETLSLVKAFSLLQKRLKGEALGSSDEK
jgi:flagellar biogenesis protein FliO